MATNSWLSGYQIWTGRHRRWDGPGPSALSDHAHNAVNHGWDESSAGGRGCG